MDQLPAFPDGISLRAKDSGSDDFWLPLVSPRSVVYDAILMLPGPLRPSVLRAPKFLRPQRRIGNVLEVTPQGDIVRNIFGRNIDGISAVTEVKGTLYLGHLHGDGVGEYRLPSDDEASN